MKIPGKLKPILITAALLFVAAVAAWLALNSTSVKSRIENEVAGRLTGKGAEAAVKVRGVSPTGAVVFEDIGFSIESTATVWLGNCRATIDAVALFRGIKRLSVRCRTGAIVISGLSGTTKFDGLGKTQKSNGLELGVKVGSLVINYLDRKVACGFEASSDGRRRWAKLDCENIGMVELAGGGSGGYEVSFSDLKIGGAIKLASPAAAGLADGRMSGRILVAANGDVMNVRLAESNARDLTVKNPILAPEAVNLPEFKASGTLTIKKRPSAVLLEWARVSAGGLEASIEGRLDYGLLNASLTIKGAELNEMARVLGGAELSKFDLKGGVDFSAAIEGDTGGGLKIASIKVEGAVSELEQRSARLDYLKGPFGFDFTDEAGKVIKIDVGPSNPDYVALETLPRHAIGAVIVSEDAGFFGHKGVDFKEIEAAIADNLTGGKSYVRGGSTITQQLAKNLFLGREKSLSRKLKEMMLAFELEATLPKWRILGIYMNAIEWGPGIFGIGAASRHYFGKGAQDLLPHESAYLAGVIPNPNRYYMYFAKNEISENWRARINDVLSKLNYFGYIDDEDLEKYKNEKIVFDRYREPEAEPAPVFP